MIWPGDKTSMYVFISNKQQIQPNGVDLTIGEIYRFKSEGSLGKTKILPEYEKLDTDENDYFVLRPGAYLVRYREKVKIPTNAIGLVFPRSSLQRMGATIYTSVWDSGYEGRGVGLLVVFNPHGIRIKKGARICQIIFLTAESFGEYKGEYKYEGTR